MAEDHGYRHVPCIESAADGDSPNPATIMPGIEGVPPLTQINLKPGAEIHRSRHGRHPDISQITGHIAGGDVHAPAKRDRQMREIAAYTDSLAEGIKRCPGGPRLKIIETKMAVHKIANSLDSAPPRVSRAERSPSEFEQLAVYFAISAR